MNIKNSLTTLKKVFKNPYYIILAFLIALLFYEINVFILNYNTIITIYSITGLFSSLQLLLFSSLNLQNFILKSSLIFLIMISILIGLLFSLIIYKTKMLKSENKKIGILATAGIFLGALAPGCAACGIGLITVLGLGTAVLTFLPFKGLEISALSVIILLFAVFKISNDMFACKIKIHKPFKS